MTGLIVEWIPIALMPDEYRDGRELIVWNTNGDWFKVAYCRGGLWIRDRREDCWSLVDDETACIALEGVKHWMPTLPGPRS